MILGLPQQMTQMQPTPQQQMMMQQQAQMQQQRAPLQAMPAPTSPLVAALMAAGPQQQEQQSSGSGLPLGMLAQMLNKPDDGKPDPTFGYGIGNAFSNFGVGSNLPTSQATGPLGNNNAGGMGFGASY